MNQHRWIAFFAACATIAATQSFSVATESSMRALDFSALTTPVIFMASSQDKSDAVTESATSQSEQAINQGDKNKAKTLPAKTLPAKKLTIEFILEQFDSDKDGRLSDAEREKARQWLKAQRTQSTSESAAPSGPVLSRQAILKEFDTDLDGKLSATERNLAKKKIDAMKRGSSDGREELIKKLDKDRDGRLNELERKELQEIIETISQSQLEDVAEVDDRVVTATTERPRIERSWLLEQFDANKDGRLDDQEKEKARQTIRERRQINP